MQESCATSATPPVNHLLPDYDEPDSLDHDVIVPEPTYEILKRNLEREKVLKVKIPEPYHGRSIKEWKTFTSGWEAVFRAQPWIYNSHSFRVNSAATALKGNPHDLWEASLKDNSSSSKITWGKFKSFLANMIQAPASRRQEAFEKLRRLEQEANEFVADLYARMVEIEADCRDIPEKDRIRTLDAVLTYRETKKILGSMLYRKLISFVFE